MNPKKPQERKKRFVNHKKINELMYYIWLVLDDMNSEYSNGCCGAAKAGLNYYLREFLYLYPDQERGFLDHCQSFEEAKEVLESTEMLCTKDSIKLENGCEVICIDEEDFINILHCGWCMMIDFGKEKYGSLATKAMMRVQIEKFLHFILEEKEDKTLDRELISDLMTLEKAQTILKIFQITPP